jgi:hypothetical protein
MFHGEHGAGRANVQSNKVCALQNAGQAFVARQLVSIQIVRRKTRGPAGESATIAWAPSMLDV